MQIKYRIPASEIIRLSLSPYFDDIAVFHVKAVCFTFIKFTDIIQDIMFENFFNNSGMKENHIFYLGKSNT